MRKKPHKNKGVTDKLNVTHRRNLDNMKLLVSHEEFQKLVRDIRAYLDIPEKGLNVGTEVSEWFAQHYQRTNEMLADKSFLKEASGIKNKFQKSLIFEEAELKLQKHYDKVPINFFKNRLKLIIESFNLPDHYETYIRDYILTNKVNAPAQNFVTSAYIDPAQPGERYVNVKIYSKLTNDDLATLKIWVNEMFGTQLPEYQKLKDIDTKLELEEWYKNRTKMDTVENQYYTMSAEEIAEEILGNKDQKRQVYESVNELRKLRKKRFGK